MKGRRTAMHTHNVALAAALLGLLAGVGGRASGQQTSTAPRADSVFLRAQRLANDGNTAGGRTLVDSVLRAVPEGSATFIDALYFRAGLAAGADESRQDYLRIVVEYPLSRRAEDALLRLAQLEFAVGDRAAARRHLERLALEHAAGASRAQGALWLARVLLEEGTMPLACATLDTARARAATSDVELLNQITYYGRPCATVRQATLDSVRADSVARAEAARRDSVQAAEGAAQAAKRARRTAVTPRTTPARQWSVQVAAYSTKEEADRFAARLASRGLDARVTAEKPFRVRIGRFSSRSEAVELATKLKEQKTAAIVVEAERP